MALDDLNQGNEPDIPETIDPQAVILNFRDNPVKAEILGKHGQHLWRLLMGHKNPRTGEYYGCTWMDIREKHCYRADLLEITKKHGQTDIVDACLLEDLEGLRTHTNRGIVKFPYMDRGITSLTEFAVSTALEVARLLENPNGRIKRKLDEIPLEVMVEGFWWYVSKNTDERMRMRTGLNILILALERQAKEPPEDIESAKHYFARETLPLLRGSEDFLMIPDNIFEGIIPHLRRYSQSFYNLYRIVMEKSSTDNLEIAAKLERCPRFRKLVDAEGEAIRFQKEEAIAAQTSQAAAEAANRVQQEKEKLAERESQRIKADKKTALKMVELDKDLDTYEPSEEVFALGIVTNASRYNAINLINTGNPEQSASVSDFDIRGYQCYSDETKASYAALSAKMAAKKVLWLGQIANFTDAPTPAIYRRIIDKEFPESSLEATLLCLDYTMQRLSNAQIFSADCIVFQLLSAKREKVEAHIKKVQEEIETAEVAREYHETLSTYQKTVESVEKRKQAAIKKHKSYPETSEKKHIKELIEARSTYLKELYAIGTRMGIGAYVTTENEDEDVLAYVELGGHGSRGGGGGGGMRLELRQTLTLTLSQSDRIVTETGNDLERRRTRLEMVDWTTAHEVSHIIDVLHREEDSDQYSNRVITRHLDELAGIAKELSPADRKFYVDEIRELMEECMIDGIGYRLIQNYGTGDFEYDRQDHRLVQAAHSFIAACTIARYNMGLYLAIVMGKEQGIRFCLILQRFIAAAKIHLENLSQSSYSTLEDAILDLQEEIVELENLYFEIQIKIADESGG